jgi:RsiW-degrading membrane proteinase PrsW (M82 family)
MSIITIISLLIATAIPLIALYIIYTRDLYSTGAFKFVAICFGWGLIAFGLAFFTNRFLLNSAGVDWAIVVQYIAPIEEEILKGLILLFLVRRRQFTYFVDGAIYGFAIGIGFAVIENYSYLFSIDQGGQLMVAVVRVISTNLMHAAGSSIIGIAMGLSRFSRRSGKILYALAGLLVSGSLHVVFNVVSNSEFTNTLILIITISVIGLISFGVIVFAIRQGLKESKAWIEEKLGMADRVTAGETKAVLSLKNIDEILSPLAEQFGPEKAEHIETLLKQQARLGILRKNMDKLQDESLLADTRQEIEEVRSDMEIARQAIGSYAMVYLRGIFPEEDSQLWGQLENIISDRISASPTPQAGGLWDQLGQQVVPPPGNNDPEG